MNDEYTLYLDLDGVLVDFELKAHEITLNHFKELTTGNMWSAIAHYNNNVEPFFENLPKTKGADELVEFATSNFKIVKILSATGTTPKDAARQKRTWGYKNYPNVPVITVTSSSEKAIYANPRSILVDDRNKSIGPWRKAGGVGILFLDNDQTISELKQFI